MTNAAPLELEVRHETRYRYAAPVSLAHHLAHLEPLVDDHQQLLLHEATIEPEPQWMHTGRDGFGNACRWFSHARPHHELRVAMLSRVRVHARFEALEPQVGEPWDELAARLHYVAHAPYEPAVAFTLPSPFVPRLDALADYARASFPPGRSVAAGALELMRRVHADFTYRSASTQVDTPLADAFATRTGVCQDFTHVLIGALRMLGLPARYVSGYLLTRAPDAAADMVGADASHAWAQVWCPGTPGIGADAPAHGAPGGWLDLDPTNDVVPSRGHVRLAVGRDFGDVTPLRGVIRGGGSHTLEVAVDTRVVSDAPGVAGGSPDMPSGVLQSGPESA